MSITSQADYDKTYPLVPLERWKSNILEAAHLLSDEDGQSEKWPRESRNAWGNPSELICALLDDAQFERYLADCNFSLSEPQLQAGRELLSKLDSFVAATPETLDPITTLQDGRWAEIRFAARRFVASMQMAPYSHE